MIGYLSTNTLTRVDRELSTPTTTGKNCPSSIRTPSIKGTAAPRGRARERRATPWLKRQQQLLTARGHWKSTGEPISGVMSRGAAATLRSWLTSASGQLGTSVYIFIMYVWGVGGGGWGGLV